MGRLANKYEVPKEARELINFPDLTPTAKLIAVWMQLHESDSGEWPTKSQIEKGIGAGTRTFERAWKILLAESIVRATD